MSAHGLGNGATRTIAPSQPEAVGDAKTTPAAGPL